MADIDGKDAVEILCMMENEEKDETVLMLSKGFLSQKLQIGDMYYLWWVSIALKTFKRGIVFSVLPLFLAFYIFYSYCNHLNRRWC